MKVVGLITEYNPFHNGHLYHLQQAKKITGADYVVAVMSGNFLQRAEPAVIDKFSRAHMALSCGVDLVLELPAWYACASAEYFARGAVTLLDSLGIVDFLCFGSESGELSGLSHLADILSEEPEEYQNSLKGLVSSGLSYPAAREAALRSYLENNAGVEGRQPEDLSRLLTMPNNILAVEYLKALKSIGSRIRPVTVRRISSGYHESGLKEHISSASAIRGALKECSGFGGPENITFLKEQLPGAAYDCFRSSWGVSCPVFPDDLSQMMGYRLLAAKSVHGLYGYFDLSEDLAKRIFNLRLNFCGMEQFTRLVCTKHYTQTRVRRALLHLLLEIKTEDVAAAQREHTVIPYIRVLGFQKSSAVLLTEIKKRSTLPLLTKLADTPSILAASPAGELSEKMLSCDIFSSQVYHCAAAAKFHQGTYNEYTRQLVILPSKSD